MLQPLKPLVATAVSEISALNFTVLVGTVSVNPSPVRAVPPKPRPEELIDLAAERIDELLSQVAGHFDEPVATEILSLLRRISSSEEISTAIAPNLLELREEDHRLTVDHDLSQTFVRLHPGLAKSKLAKRLALMRAVLEYALAHDAFVAMPAELARVFIDPVPSSVLGERFSITDADLVRRNRSLSRLIPVAAQKLLLSQIPSEVWQADLEVNVTDEASRLALKQWITRLRELPFHEYVIAEVVPGTDIEVSPEEAELWWDWVQIQKRATDSGFPKERNSRRELPRKQPA